MRRNDETWSRCLVQRRTHIRPISDTAETDYYGMTPPLCFKYLQTLELQTWSFHAVKWKPKGWSRQSAVGRRLAPLKHSFLDGLPDLSGHCHFTTMCVMPEAEHCWRSDVSAANRNWLSGQLLPYHVTSSHSYLRCSVWRSMCSHPSPSDTQTLRKVLPLLQEHKCWKIACFLPNRTHNFLKSSYFCHSKRYYTGLIATGYSSQLSPNEPACGSTFKTCKWPFGWRITFL